MPQIVDRALHVALTHIRNVCVGRHWELNADKKEIFDKAMPKTQPPKELFEEVPVKLLASQFRRLHAWVHEIGDQEPEAFFALESLLVQAVRSDGDNARPFQISREDIREGSQWRRSYIPTIGTHVISKKHGKCIVKGVQTRPKMKPMYERIMSASLQQIRSREVYHIVFAWHLYQHASISSESLAESVGSFLKIFPHIQMCMEI